MSLLLPSQIPDGLERLVGGLDRLAVQFEGTLGLDQRDQLLDRIDVGGFEETLEDLACAVFAGLGLQGRAARFGLGVDATAELVEALRVNELEDLELADG